MLHLRDEKVKQFLVENLNGWNHFGDLGIDGKIILKFILEK